ncbi:MAG TPA: M13 family metallopeptidase, partial [Sphingomonadales bacterium]|nr:M13 family metallopeptidase [Sphingomonadales bacterium]
QKIGDFYASLVDATLVEGKGAAPVRPYLERIDAIADAAALYRAFGENGYLGIDAPFGAVVFPDLGDSTRNMAYLFQSGLGLPDRDYYLKEDEKFAAIRAAYPGYIASLFELAGYDNPGVRAGNVVAIEMKIAEAHWPAQENRNLQKLYNLRALTELSAINPAIQWNTFLEGAGLAAQKELVVAQLSYFEALGAIVGGAPLEAWKDYLRFHTLDGAAQFLSSEFEDAHFAFQGKLVNGLEEKTPRWKRSVRVINGSLGEGVGKVYVDRHFPPEAKAGMEELVTNLLEAFRTGIQELEWMSLETKAKAEEKRAKMMTKIGYPEKWETYEGMEIVKGDPIANLAAANRWGYQDNINKLNEEIDRTEWSMTPQTVNAYHNPTFNEIVFPAGMLQPPYFNLAADPAASYGAIGAVIGHEIGHAFDDQGRRFDGDGNMRDWWQGEDAEKFEAAAARLVAQYNAYEVLPSLFVNGQLTLGENIGDLTGVTIAYRAYHNSLQGEEAPVIDGLTGDQRFFLGYAQAYRAKMRDEFIRQIVVSDPHSPSKYRVNGIFRNFPPFYEAFGVKEGDGMYLPPEERVQIW